MIGALARTRPVLAKKGEVSMAMVKWWKKKRPQDAEVRNNKEGGPLIAFSRGVVVLKSNRRGRQTDHRRVDGDHHEIFFLLYERYRLLLLFLSHYFYSYASFIAPFRLRCTFPLMNSSLFFLGSRLSRRRLSTVSPPTFGRLALSQLLPELCIGRRLVIIWKTLYTDFRELNILLASCLEENTKEAR